MELFYREKGAGYPVIILHGLWGSSDNWLRVAGLLADKYRVIIPDMRNHGQSPHDKLHDYDSMAGDIAELIKKLRLKVKPYVIGHSMGGKVAMTILLKNPEIIKKAIIIDIAPTWYMQDSSSIHPRLVDFMNTTMLSHFSSRNDIMVAITRKFDQEKCRQLLLKNVTKTEEGFEWKINYKVIGKNLYKLFDWPRSKCVYQQDILFIKGQYSSYISDPAIIKKIFPAAQLRTIPCSGHWIHTDQPERLAEVIREFLTPTKSSL